WRRGGKETKLDFAGHCDVALKLLLLPADCLIETRVLNGDGDLRGQRGEDALMFFIEEAGARVLEIEHADDAALVKEGHDHLRAGFRIHFDIALIFAYIGHIDHAPLAHGCADQAAGDGEAAFWRVRVAEAPGITRD